MTQDGSGALSPTDDEADYRAQVARYPRLSDEEQGRLLATRGTARDAANRTLIEHNLYLVFEAVHARRECGIAFGELFQEGSLALISAVEHYTETVSGFTSALSTAIATSLDAVVAKTMDAQRNDRAFVTACRLLETAEQLLAGRLKRPATDAEIAQLLHWDEPRVQAIHEMLAEARGIHDQELVDYLDEVGPEGGESWRR